MRNGKDTSDEDIIREILDGDKDAYGVIVLRYESKLTRYVRSIIGKSHDTDDIVQNVFIKAYRNLTAFDTKLAFSSWIYRIAHNESVNHIKSSVVQKIVSMGEWFDYGKSDDTESNIDRDFRISRLHSCLRRLDVKYKEPLVLFYLEEKSYQEISDILRIPVRAVGVRIHRARDLIRRECHEKHFS